MIDAIFALLPLAVVGAVLLIWRRGRDNDSW